jgi:hypothetical protein
VKSTLYATISECFTQPVGLGVDLRYGSRAAEIVVDVLKRW